MTINLSTGLFRSNLDHHWFNTVVPEQLRPPLVLVEIEFLTLQLSVQCFVLFIIPLSYLFLPFTASAHSLAFCGVFCPIYHPFVLFIPAIYGFCSLVSFLWSVLSYLSSLCPIYSCHLRLLLTRQLSVECFVLFIIPLSYLFLPFTASAYSLAFCGVFCPIYHHCVLFIPAIYGFCSLFSFLWSVLSYLSSLCPIYSCHLRLLLTRQLSVECFVLFIIPLSYLFLPFTASAHSLAFCGVFCPIYHPFVLFIPAIYGFCSLVSFLWSVLSYLSTLCPIYSCHLRLLLTLQLSVECFVLFIIPLSYLFLPFTASAHSLAFCGVLCPIYHPFVLFIPAIYGFCSLVSFLWSVLSYLSSLCPIYSCHLRLLLTLQLSVQCFVLFIIPLSYLFLPFTASAHSLAFCGVFCPIYHPFVLFIPAIYGFCSLVSFLWSVLSYLSSLCPIYSCHLRLLLTLQLSVECFVLFINPLSYLFLPFTASAYSLAFCGVFCPIYHPFVLFIPAIYGFCLLFSFLWCALSYLSSLCPIYSSHLRLLLTLQLFVVCFVLFIIPLSYLFLPFTASAHSLAFYVVVCPFYSCHLRLLLTLQLSVECFVLFIIPLSYLFLPFTSSAHSLAFYVVFCPIYSCHLRLLLTRQLSVECFVLFIIPLSYLFLPFTASAYSLAFCGVFCPIYHPFVLFIPAIYGFCSLVSFLWSVLSYLSSLCPIYSCHLRILLTLQLSMQCFVLFIPAIYGFCLLFSFLWCVLSYLSSLCPIYSSHLRILLTLQLSMQCFVLFIPAIYGFCLLVSFLWSVLSYLSSLCPIYSCHLRLLLTLQLFVVCFVLFIIPLSYLFLPFTASAYSLAFCGVFCPIYHPFVLFIPPIYGFCSLFSFLCSVLSYLSSLCPIYSCHLRLLLTLQLSVECFVLFIIPLSYLFLPFTASAYSLAFCGVLCPIYHPFVLFISAIYGFCLLVSFLWSVLSYLSSLCPIYSCHLRLLLTLQLSVECLSYLSSLCPIYSCHLRLLLTLQLSVECFVLFIPAMSSAHSLAFCGVLCPIYHPFVLFIPAIYGFCSLSSFLCSVLSYLSTLCPIYSCHFFCSLFSFLCSVLSYLSTLCPIYSCHLRLLLTRQLSVECFVLFIIPLSYFFLPFTASAYSLAFCGVLCPIYHPFVLFISAIYGFCLLVSFLWSVLSYLSSLCPIYSCHLRLLLTLQLSVECFVLFIIPLSYLFLPFTASAYSLAFCGVICPIYHPFVLFIPAMSSAYSLAFCGVLCPIYHPFVLFIPAIYGFCSLSSFLWSVLSYLSTLCPIYSCHFFCSLFSFLWSVLSYLSTLCPIYSCHLRLLLTRQLSVECFVLFIIPLSYFFPPFFCLLFGIFKHFLLHIYKQYKLFVNIFVLLSLRAICSVSPQVGKW